MNPFAGGNVIPMNLDGAIHLYLERRAAIGEKWRPATARNTGYLLRSWARHIDGEDWRTPDLDDVLDWAIVPNSQDGKHRRMSCVRTFYRKAYQWGWIDVEVASRLTSISGSEGGPNPIPGRVFRRALAGAGPVDYRALVLGRWAGLRAGEIAGVHSDHLDGGQLFVEREGRS